MDHSHEDAVGKSNPDESSKPASSAANHCTKSQSRRHRRTAGHVSFAPSVLADRPSTSRVTVVEEHGVYIDALGRRVAQSALISENGGGSRGLAEDDMPHCAVAAGKERISRSADAGKHAHEKGHVGFAVDKEAKATNAKDPNSDASIGNGEGQIQYDSLTINLGLLKCGYRYQTTVPIHVVQDGDNGCEEKKGEDVQYDIIEIGESLDPDLEVEAVSNAPFACDEDGVDDATATTATDVARDHIQIRIAARRPGKYQSSFSVIAAQTSLSSCGNKETRQSQRRVVSLRVKATLLGKDQGKPQLKANIIKLGKLVGYDSDDETEWQGFPESDDGGCDGSGGDEPPSL